MANKLAREESKGSQAEYKRSVAEMNARAGLSKNPKFGKDVKPVGDADIDKFKPGRIVTNRSDGRKAVVAYRPTSNKVMVYPKGGGKEEYWHMDECVGSKEAKAADTLQGLNYSDKTKCPQCAGVGERTTGNKCAACNGTGRVTARAKDVKPVGVSNYTYERQTAVPLATRGATAEEVKKYGKTAPTAKDETFRVFDSGEVVEVGDAQDHPDPAVQAKVDKYRATALAQGFRSESVEKSIKQLLGEGRFKATSRVSDADDLAGVRKRYDELKGRSREDLFKIYSRSHRVNSAEKAPKGDLIAGIMEAEFGAKKYEAAFAKDATAPFKPGDKVWANPIGRSGGTVKGTVARINASGQVVIESGGREREFHPSNVRASDVRPVGAAVKFGDLKVGDKFKYQGREFVKYASNSASKASDPKAKYVSPFHASAEVERAGDVRPVGDGMEGSSDYDTAQRILKLSKRTQSVSAITKKLGGDEHDERFVRNVLAGKYGPAAEKLKYED